MGSDRVAHGRIAEKALDRATANLPITSRPEALLAPER
jgi:hypothetical protein